MENEEQAKPKAKWGLLAVIAVLLIVVAVLAYRSISKTSLTSDEHSSSWLMLGYEASRTNYNIVDDLNPSLKKKKVIKMGTGLSGENLSVTMFAADKNNLYVLSHPKTLKEEKLKSKAVAFSLETGKKRWEYGGPMFGVGALDEDNLYGVSSNPQKVFAVKLSTGKKVWESKITDKATGKGIYAPVVRQGMVYVIAEDAKLYAFDSETGKKKWTYSELYLVGSPAVSGGIVFCLTQDVRVLALNAETGKQEWLVGAPDWKTLLNPAIGNGQVYIVDRDRKGAIDTLFALDAKTGKFQWNYRIKKNVIVNGMCIGKDRVFVMLGEFEKAKPENKAQGEVVAMDPATGKKVWSEEVWGMPGYIVGAADTFYIGSTRIWREPISGDMKAEGGKAIAVSMGNGKTIEEYEIVSSKQDDEKKFMQPPLLISNGQLFAQNVVDNTVHIYGK